MGKLHLPKAMMTAFMCLGLFNPAAAASLPGGASTLLETYDDWAVACRAQSSVVGCVLRQVQSNSQTGEQMLAAELRNLPEGRMDGALLLPFGLALAQGVTLKVDDAAALPVLAFSTCLPGGCVAPVKLDAATVAKLKSGNALNVSATLLASGEAIPMKLSLKGLSKAMARASELMKLEKASGSPPSLSYMPQRASQPPSTARIWPVTYELAGEAKNRTAVSRSDGSPQRPTGIRSRMERLRLGSLRSASVLSVSI